MRLNYKSFGYLTRLLKTTVGGEKEIKKISKTDFFFLPAETVIINQVGSPVKIRKITHICVL